MKRGGKVPLGVKIISILYYIGAGVFSLSALALIITGIAVMMNSNLIETINQIPSFIKSSPNIGAAVLITGFLIALLAVLEFFIAKGLYRGKRWARILVIIFVAIGLVTGFRSLFSGEGVGLINLFFSVVVGGYLLFNKEAKLFFSR